METGLRDKGVLVIGASGGIGSACARAFAEEGARVAVHYHRAEARAGALAREIGAGESIRADLTREDDVDRLFDEARAQLGRLDVCAFVSGTWPEQYVPLWEMPLERWERTVAENLTTAFLASRAFLREVARNGHGSLVLVGSTAGIFGEAGHADYAASKSALMAGLLLSIKNEIVRVAPRARVNVVAPGWTMSPMVGGALADKDAIDLVTRTMALRKVATPEDVAGHVVVLASDFVSGHVTGTVVTVHGGMEGRTVHP